MADEYQAVCVYDLDGVFLGYTIGHTNIPKLWSTHLYLEATDNRKGEEDDLREDLERLNQGAEMSAHWPDRDDPEFIALINDPNFEPIEYSLEEVIDDDAVQAMLDSGELEPPDRDPVSGNTYWRDPELLPTARVKVPADPSAPQARIRKAAETIALKRMAAGS